MQIVYLLVAVLMFAGCRTKPECFECGLTQEWNRAEQEREHEEDATALAPAEPGEPAEPAPQRLAPIVVEPNLANPQPFHDTTTRPREEWAPMPATAGKNCADHKEAIEACSTRGPNWVYDLVVPSWNKGVRPPDDWREQAEQMASCQCYNRARAAYERQKRPPPKSSPTRDDQGAGALPDL